jgi:hypothetical protein
MTVASTARLPMAPEMLRLRRPLPIPPPSLQPLRLSRLRLQLC